MPVRIAEAMGTVRTHFGEGLVTYFNGSAGDRLAEIN